MPWLRSENASDCIRDGCWFDPLSGERIISECGVDFHHLFRTECLDSGGKRRLYVLGLGLCLPCYIQHKS